MPHHSWQEVLSRAYDALDTDYRAFLESDKGYFPTKEHYLNAFKTLPREKVKYILFGQDPYPRLESAGGYAFIDEKVKKLFSENGFSKEVNRATSLRNFIKMVLVARGDLSETDTSQQAIAALDKTLYIETITQLRMNFEKNGVLLLNTALIFTDKKHSAKHVKAWRPFMASLLNDLQEDAPELILFGNHAKELKKVLPLEQFGTIEMEHPYNHTFITNKNAQQLFGLMRLLEK
jgi:uracil-DNA glycosylase